jgi:carbonic anhydrase
MVDIASKKIQFVQGLVERAGWDEATAEKHFNYFAPLYEIENEIEFVVSEAERLCLKYPKMLVVPLFYNLEDSLLYLISR